MTEKDIIVGLNSIAAALSLVKHAIAEQVTGHDGVSAEYIAQKAKEYILQNREVTQ